MESHKTLAMRVGDCSIAGYRLQRYVEPVQTFL